MPLPEGAPQRAETLPTQISPETLPEVLNLKVAAAWDALVGVYDFADAEAYTEVLLGALIAPETTPQAFAKAQWNRVYNSTRNVLQAPIWEPAAVAAAKNSGHALASEQFADDFRTGVLKTMLLDLNPAECLFANGYKAYTQAFRRGAKIIPWTNGGDLFQVNKMLGIGFALDPSVTAGLWPLRDQSTAPKAEISVTPVISDDKLRPAELERVRELAGDRQILLVEDRTKNILSFLETFPTARAFWTANQGDHARKSYKLLQEYRQSPGKMIDELRALHAKAIHANKPLGKKDAAQARKIEQIVALDYAILARRIVILKNGMADFADVLKGYYGGGPLDHLAIVTDLDDTLIDNNKRRNLQHKMVVDCVRRLLGEHKIIVP